MDVSRRRFLSGRAPGPAPFRPPWSVPEALFLDRCTRCGECVKVCPTGVLRTARGGYPEAGFSEAGCTLCGDCTWACTTGAIGRDVSRRPWPSGIAIGEGCLAAQGVECRVCGEACDAAAIRFRPRLGGVPLPEVDDGRCSGCGACVPPCPVTAIQRVAVAPCPECP